MVNAADGEQTKEGRGRKPVDVLPRKEREKLHRRQSILAAAKHLFYDKGYHTVTMEDIAEEAELSKGTLYLYFDSKDELYISIIMEGFELLEERLDKILESGGGIDERGKKMFFAFIDHCLENREHFRITQYFLNENARQNISEKLIESVTEQNLRLLTQVARLMQEGIDAGQIREDVNPLSFAVIAWRTATGMLDLALVGDNLADIGPGSYSDLFESGFDILMNGVRRTDYRR